MQEVTQLDISSTLVRRLIARGDSPRFLLPDAVLAIIERTGLYRTARTRTKAKGPGARLGTHAQQC